MTCSDSFKLRNNIDFDVQHLCLEEKRKEIQKYDPLHYVFGEKLKDKSWLIYGGKYE